MKGFVRKVLIAMLLGVVVYGGFAIYRGIDKIGQALGHFHSSAFVIACALAFTNYVIRYFKWEFYLARLDIRGVKKVDSFFTFLAGFVLTVTPGKVGEVFKSLILFETYGVAMTRTAPIVVAERATDVVGIVLLIIFGATVGFSGGLLWAGIGAALVLVLLLVVGNKKLSLSLIGLVAKLPGRIGKIAPKLEASYESLATMLAPRNLFVPSLLSAAAWMMECLALWVILRGFGESTSVALSTFFYSTSTLIGAIIPVPGGLGVTESALLGQMTELGHVEANVATSAMILVRFATLWFAVIVGFISLSIMKRRFPKLLADDGSTEAPKLDQPSSDHPSKSS